MRCSTSGCCWTRATPPPLAAGGNEPPTLATETPSSRSEVLLHDPNPSQPATGATGQRKRSDERAAPATSRLKLCRANARGGLAEVVAPARPELNADPCAETMRGLGDRVQPGSLTAAAHHE